MIEHQDFLEESINPLDSVEDMMMEHEWVFDRPNPDELSVTVNGNRGVYRLTFLWQEEYGALQFFCETANVIPEERMDVALRALKNVNESLWLGSFDIPAASHTPVFRYTSLMGQDQNASVSGQIESLVEIALAECERFHNAFSAASSADYSLDDVLGIAAAGTGGNA